jgi:hypothetical protein
VRELAALLGLTPSEAQDLAARSGLPVGPGPSGEPSVPRRDLADRLLPRASPPSLVEPAASPWPGTGPVERAPGEPDAEDREEESTEETSEEAGASEPELPRGILTVRYFGRMTPGRSFPLLVQGTKLTAPLRAVPRLPGCLCVPSGEDLRPESPRAEFWVTPQAVGPAPGAAVEIHGDGKRIAEARVPFLVRRLTQAWALLALAGLFLALAVVLEAVPPSAAKDTLLARLLAAAGGGAPAGLLLSIAAFGSGAAWFFFANPKEANAVTISLSPRPGGGSP